MSASSNATRPAVLVIGSANADLVVRAHHIPRPGETVLGGELAVHAGGKGANQAVAAARLGADARFIGRVGDDSHGEFLKRSLEADGVDVSHLRVTPDCPTGVALIVVDGQGQNAICVSPGANARVTMNDIDSSDPAYKGAAVCLLQHEIPLEIVKFAASCCQKLKIRVILNPAPFSGDPVVHTIPADVIVPNAAEAAAMLNTAIPETPEAALTLAERLTGRAPAAVITLGEQGAVVADTDGCEHIRGHRVDAVDTTGAGDAFCGALAYGLASEQPLRDAVRFANAAAAMACRKPGAQSAMPTLQEVRTALATRR